MWTEFDPKKHNRAFGRDLLYEMRSERKGKILLIRYEKVTSKSVYELALSLPIYFAVRELSP